ncbi:MAG TPA: hypothetical protein V6D17_02945 [Candidatus Obscuribacterales bacterium]
MAKKHQTTKSKKQATRRNVLLTIRASSAEEALKIARRLRNFELDESYTPISFEDGEWVVSGVATGNITSKKVVAVNEQTDIQLPPPDADVQ